MQREMALDNNFTTQPAVHRYRLSDMTELVEDRSSGRCHLEYVILAQMRPLTRSNFKMK